MSESALEIQKRLFGAMFAQSAETEPAPTTLESVQADVPTAKTTAELPAASDATEGVIDLEESISLTTENDLINDIKLYADKGKSFEFILKELQETLQAYPARQPISDARLEELIRLHANQTGKTEMPVVNTYPPELAPLVASGACFYSDYKNGRPNHVMVKWCSVCHNFGKDECCGKPAIPKMADSDGDLTRAGRQALGLEPIDPVKTAEQKETERIDSWKESSWWMTFRGVDELQGDGTVQWIIKDVLPAGVTVVSSNPKDGKSFLVLSLVKAITTGQAWLGRAGFEVPEARPVLWLAAESGDSGLKIRCQKFRITKDKTRFICRTLNQGVPNLKDRDLEQLIRTMKPYVVLETLVRFGDGEDENDAKEANKLATNIFGLISMGAPGVLCIHHSRKDLKRGGIDLEKAIRGSGDYTAMADAIWVIARDESLYSEGKGPNEVKMQGWGRDFNPYPMRLALTKKAPKDLKPGIVTFAPGICSIIDETGDLGWVDENSRQEAVEVSDKEFADRLEWLVQKHPTITLKELANRTGQNLWRINAALKDRGWSKPAGRAKKGETHQWAKADTAATAA